LTVAEASAKRTASVNLSAVIECVKRFEDMDKRISMFYGGILKTNLS